MLDKIFSKKKDIPFDKRKIPRHIAISINGDIEWAAKHKKSNEEAYDLSFKAIKKLIVLQTKLSIPILTFYLFSGKKLSHPEFPVFTDYILGFFDSLKGSKLLHDNQIKVSVLGKWYDLPSRLVDPIKGVIDETKSYDRFFVNFCINYNGHEEIIAACRLIARKIKAEKLDPDSINKALIKENLYSSYFLPPELIIVTGGKKHFSGLLLWDAAFAPIFFSEKLWPDFDRAELMKAIDESRK